MAEVRRPPVLLIGHQSRAIFLHSSQVEALELFCVVEVLAHRVGLGGMLVQDLDFQLIRPPVAVRRASTGCLFVCSARYRALSVVSHNVTYH